MIRVKTALMIQKVFVPLDSLSNSFIVSSNSLQGLIGANVGNNEFNEIILPGLYKCGLG